MLGLEPGIVRLVPHDERWHEFFAAEEALLQEAVGEFVGDVQHIGSTSVCGISAKPVLDIAAAIKSQADGVKCIAPLEHLGYIYRGENGIAGRFYFVKGEPARTHHLHIFSESSDEWRNHLFFRDYLRRNGAAAARYDKLKKDLAKKHGSERSAYTDAKAAFIERILKKRSKI
jgi:GrpB-like predicted nucleotidyltransferase (UPF0157 family)